jgi:hypothetical protein
VPPLCAEASSEPSAAIASANAAISAASLWGVRPTDLSINALRTLSAAYGVSWRARAESGATNQLVAIRPWGVNPFGSSVPSGSSGGTWPLLARQYNQRAGG